jgi:hypothetical protein
MFRAQVLRHTVPAALSLPVTGSPPVRTITLLILPPVALTVIPRFGAVSMPPPTGVIDNRTPSAAAPDIAWLAARVGPPEQPAASKPSVAQITVIATAHPRGPNDRREIALGVAARSNFEPPDCNQTAYARAPSLPPTSGGAFVLGPNFVRQPPLEE